jgi:hypothetical protein
VSCSRAAGGSARPASHARDLGAEQPAPRRRAVVIEHGLHALLPLAPLIDQRVTQPHAGAQVEQMPGRNP